MFWSYKFISPLMQNFPLCLSNGNIVLHLVPPSHKLTLGEFFYQVSLVRSIDWNWCIIMCYVDGFSYHIWYGCVLGHIKSGLSLSSTENGVQDVVPSKPWCLVVLCHFSKLSLYFAIQRCWSCSGLRTLQMILIFVSTSIWHDPFSPNLPGRNSTQDPFYVGWANTSEKGR